MPSFVDIQDSDYEQRRHASELAVWVNLKLREIEAGGCLDVQYFERRGRNVKRLIEEALPLSRLGLYLWTPGNEPYVTTLPISDPVDGLIEVESIYPRSFHVEITTLETEESTMRRQALARTGYAPLGGPIHRTGRRLEYEPEMIDVAKAAEHTIELVIKRLDRKVRSVTQTNPAAILVYLSPFRTLPQMYRSALRRRTEQYLASEVKQALTVYYCYWPEYVIEAVDFARR
jgi:hypothetical protein